MNGMLKQISGFLILLISCSLLIGTVKADWAYMFVVNDGKIYVISESKLDAKQIGAKLGKVTEYSDHEGTYSGNFSNKYPEGTEYYKIKDININKAIAIKEMDGLFIKANYGGEYGGSDLLYIFGVILLIIISFRIKRILIKKA